MESLIRELEALRKRPQLTNSEFAGAMIAMAARLRDVTDQRMLGLQALVSAVAMQPHIDAMKLHDDFVNGLKSRFESLRLAPSELQDIAAQIKLVAAERK